MEPVIDDEIDSDTHQEWEQTDQEPTDGEDRGATWSHSRSSSAHPPNDLADVFDEYWYEGQHSIINCEDDNETRTFEARPSTPAKRSLPTLKPELPPVDTTTKPASIADATTSTSEDIAAPAFKPLISPVNAPAEAAAASTSHKIHHKESKKASVPNPHGQQSSPQRNRHEKSGIPELDGDLPDIDDEDSVRTSHDEGEGDLDSVEVDAEGRSWIRATSLFARGVVDRYRLAVFRKGSTPNRSGIGAAVNAVELPVTINDPSSSSLITKARSLRTSALSFRRRASMTFLRTKSPLSTPS